MSTSAPPRPFGGAPADDEALAVVRGSRRPRLADVQAVLGETMPAACDPGPRPFTFRDRTAARSGASTSPAAGVLGDAPDLVVRRSALVVDDDPQMLDTLHDMLAPGGFRVVTAADGEEGLWRFTRTPVDVVVTDLAMPRMNGLQLARACKRVNPSVPVVMVTAWDVLLTDEDLGDHGVALVLSKPLRPSSLLRAVAEVTQRS
jgi:CheY-like chemotaxis protein